VFELEQHLPEKFDETDDRALHAILYLDGEAVACGRAFLEETDSSVWHLGRFAVRAPYRRRGLGSLVLRALEDEALARGAQRFVLDAQLQAEPFYRAHGYAAVTDAYRLCGCAHVTMCRNVCQPRGV
jgi:predicted GNAT family N-acyltransferase